MLSWKGNKMIKKIVKFILIFAVLLPIHMVYPHAESVEEGLLLQMDIKEDDIHIQEQSLPQSRSYRNMVYLEAGKILNYGTGTYLYDYGMNAATISYNGTTSLALMQELFLNGMRVYCVEPEVLTADGAGYQMGVSNGYVSSIEKRELGLISYFGYGYQGDTSDTMSAATIVAIWIARGRVVSDVSEEVMEKVHLIQRRVANVDVRPSFEYENMELKGYGKEHAITLYDNNQVLVDYQIYQDGGYSIEKSGNSLKIWLEKGKSATGKIVFDRIDRNAQGNQIIYINPDGKQTLMSIAAQDSESVEFQPSLVKGGVRIMKVNEDGVALPNTTFQLSYQADMGNPIGTFTTNAYGYVDIVQLEPMDVYVKEIAVASPYVLDETIEKLVIKGGETISYTKVNRYKKGNLKIVKKDTSSNHTVLTQGAQFDIYTTDHRLIERITTGSDGTASSSDLRYGSYYVKEVLAPNGYVINANPIYFDITEDNVVIEKEYYDARVKARISVRKQDQASGAVPQGDATLEGAIYGLYANEDILAVDDHHLVYAKDTLISEKAIKEGSIEFDNLLLGKYYVKELVPSDGYTLDTNTYPIDCSYESQNVELIHKQQTVLERVKSQAFQIIKVSTDGTTGEIPALSGAEFTIKLKKDVEILGWERAPIAKNANYEESARLITDDKGYAVSQELPYGKYLVRETRTPVGTTTIKDFEVNIQEDNRDPQVWRIFNDAPIKAHIKVIKVDEETGNTIASPFIKFKIRNLDTNEYVKFWMKYPSPHIIDTFETDASGSFTTPEGLPYGHYQLEEIKAPQGYVLDETPLTFEITDDSAYETMEDEANVQIVLKKANKQVKGVIEIEKKAEILTRFDSQETMFGPLYQPVYAEGYLEGVTFEIYAKEDIKTLDGTLWYHANEKVETIITNKDGPVSSKQYPLGKYMVKEVATKEGYLNDAKEYEVNLTYENQTVELVYESIFVFNEKEKAEVSFQKEFEVTPFQTQTEAAKETKFGVFLKQPLQMNGQMYLQENDMVAIVSLDNQAQGKFTLDFAGEYYLKELQSDDAYILDETKHPISITYQQKHQTIILDKTIHNYTKKGNLKLMKTDEDNNPIAKVSFELSLSRDFKTVLEEKTSDINGEIMFHNLPYGTYYVREKQTTEMFVLDENVKEIMIDQSEVSNNIINRYRKSTIQIKKISDTNQVLKDVEFSLYDDFGNLLQVKQTNDDGLLLFEELKNGVYHVKETKALAGYQEMNEVLDVVIAGNDEGKVYEYEVVNTFIVKTGIEESTTGNIALMALGIVIFLCSKHRKKMIGHKNSNKVILRIK